MRQDLERRYDGPIPPDLLDPARPERRAQANAAWGDRAARDARRDIARRRSAVTAAEAPADAALIRMVGMLAGYRSALPGHSREGGNPADALTGLPPARE